MTEMKDGRCPGENRDGTPCRFPADKTGFCHRHDPSPEAVERRSEAGRRAGLASGNGRRNGANLREVVAPVNLRTAEDAMLVREQALNELRAGQIDRHTARIQLQACRDHIEQFEATSLGWRMDEIEDVAREFGFEGREFWKLIDHLVELKEIPRRRR